MPCLTGTRAYRNNAPAGCNVRRLRHDCIDTCQCVRMVEAVGLRGAVEHITPQRVDLLAHRIVAIKARERVSVKEPLALHIEMRAILRVLLGVRMICERVPIPSL